MKSRFIAVLSLLCIVFGCAPEAYVTSEHFGTLSTGEDVTIWRMVNANGASMDVTDYGCRIVRINMPDRDGKMADVVVGYGDLESFEKKDRFIGPVIGRYGNRIDHASFTLDGVKYDVDATRSSAENLFSVMAESRALTNSCGKVSLFRSRGVWESVFTESALMANRASLVILMRMLPIG